jgi:hypothetical protein
MSNLGLQGLGIAEVLQAVVDKIPPPADNSSKALRALIFDSYYDSYKVIHHLHHKKPWTSHEPLSGLVGMRWLLFPHGFTGSTA